MVGVSVSKFSGNSEILSHITSLPLTSPADIIDVKGWLCDFLLATIALVVNLSNVSCDMS